MSPSSQRSLSAGELTVLEQIQDLYGSHNSADQVFFDDRGGAAIFAKDASGSSVMAVGLTNLAAWIADGTIKSIADLRRDWLVR
jgi:hypothetical protein